MMNSSDRMRKTTAMPALVAVIRRGRAPEATLTAASLAGLLANVVPGGHRSDLLPPKKRNWMIETTRMTSARSTPIAAACPKLKLLKAVR